MLEHLRSDVVLVCDRAVYRVLVAYFLGTEMVKLPFYDVKSGVLELRRTHSVRARLFINGAVHNVCPQGISSEIEFCIQRGDSFLEGDSPFYEVGCRARAWPCLPTGRPPDVRQS